MSDAGQRGHAGPARRRSLGVAPVPPRLAPAPADPVVAHRRRRRCGRVLVRGLQRRSGSGRAEFGDADHWFRFNDPDPATLQPKLAAATAVVRRDRRDRTPPGARAGHREAGRLPIAAARRPVRGAAAAPAVGPLSRSPTTRSPSRTGSPTTLGTASARRSTSTASAATWSASSRTRASSTTSSCCFRRRHSRIEVRDGARRSERRPRRPVPSARRHRAHQSACRGDLPEDVLAAVLILVVSTLVLLLVALIAPRASWSSPSVDSRSSG